MIFLGPAMLNKYRFFLKSYRFVVCLLFVFCSTVVFASYKKNAEFKFVISGIKGSAFTNVKNKLIAMNSAMFGQELDWRIGGIIRKEVKEALEPYGYFSSEVSVDINFETKNVCVLIHHGKRMKFSSIDVAIVGNVDDGNVFAAYLSDLRKKDVWFNSDYYKDIKGKLENLANVYGYFSYKFLKRELIVDVANYTSKISIVFAPGKRYIFGETKFSNTPFGTKLLKKYLMYANGKPYDYYLLENTHQNLVSSRFFSSVYLSPQIDYKKHVVNIFAHLKMQNNTVFSVGAGYGTDTGARGLEKIDVHWINRNGHSISMLARGAQENSQIAIQYYIPSFSSANAIYTIMAGASRIQQLTGYAKNVQANVGYETSIDTYKLHASLNYVVESYRLNDYPIYGKTTTTNANALYPQISIQKTYGYPNLLSPLYGYNILFVAAAGSKLIGSRTNFSQYDLSLRGIAAVPKTGVRILGRMSFGAIKAADLVKIPLSMQFYAGGANSIRGYPYNSIGPGRRIFTASFEVQCKLIDNLYVAGFVDIGNVSDNLFKDKLKVGIGPSLVYMSPVGSVNLSFAKPLLSGNADWLVQFNIGSLL